MRSAYCALRAVRDSRPVGDDQEALFSGAYQMIVSLPSMAVSGYDFIGADR